MDKFITHAGQQPIFLGDIDFFDKAVREALANVLKVITRGEDTLILSGCNIEQESIAQDDDSLTYTGTYKWTAGLVLIDGEILPIDDGQLTATSSPPDDVKVPCFSVQTIYDETGRRSLKNGDLVDCYQIRKATIVASGDVGSKYRVDYAERLDDIIEDYIKEVSQPYKQIAGKTVSGLDPSDIHIILFANDYRVSGFVKKSSTSSIVATTSSPDGQYDNNPLRFLRGAFPLTLSDESFSNVRIIPGYLETFNDDGNLGFRVMATEDIPKGTIVSFFANLYRLQ